MPYKLLYFLHAATNKAITWHTHDFYSHKHIADITVFFYTKKEKLRDLVNLGSSCIDGFIPDPPNNTLRSDITIKIKYIQNYLITQR